MSKKELMEIIETQREKSIPTTRRNPLINLDVSESKLTTKKIYLNVKGISNLFETLMSEKSVDIKTLESPNKKDLNEMINEKFIDEEERYRYEKNLERIPLKKYGSFKKITYHKDHSVSTLKEGEEIEITLPDYPNNALNRIKVLNRENNRSIEEYGSHSLFLTLGEFSWEDNKTPLIIIPVNVTVNSKNKIKMIKSGDIFQNISLKKELKSKYGYNLDFMNNDIKTYSGYKSLFKGILDKNPNWQIKEKVRLAILDAKNFIIYQDLDSKHWGTYDSFPIASLFDTNEMNKNTQEIEINSDYYKDIGEKYPLIYEADGSQYSVIKEAIDNKNNIVVEGPPGTGKSQTITNIIANALKNNKKILFVSAKKAALDVVKRKLSDKGLFDYCLDLHEENHKYFYESLDKRIGKGKNKKSHVSNYETLLKELKLKEKSLSDYYHFLNEPSKNFPNHSNIEIISKYFELEKNNEIDDLKRINIYEYEDHEEYERLILEPEIENLLKNINEIKKYYNKESLNVYEEFIFKIKTKKQDILNYELNKMNQELKLINNEIDLFNQENKVLLNYKTDDIFKINDLVNNMENNYKEIIFNHGFEEISNIIEISNIELFNNREKVKILNKEESFFEDLIKTLSIMKELEKEYYIDINTLIEIHNQIKDYKIGNDYFNQEVFSKIDLPLEIKNDYKNKKEFINLLFDISNFENFDLFLEINNIEQIEKDLNNIKERINENNKLKKIIINKRNSLSEYVNLKSYTDDMNIDEMIFIIENTGFFNKIFDKEKSIKYNNITKNILKNLKGKTAIYYLKELQKLVDFNKEYEEKINKKEDYNLILNKKEFKVSEENIKIIEDQIKILKNIKSKKLDYNPLNEEDNSKIFIYMISYIIDNNDKFEKILEHNKETITINADKIINLSFKEDLVDKNIDFNIDYLKKIPEYLKDKNADYIECFIEEYEKYKELLNEYKIEESLFLNIINSNINDYINFENKYKDYKDFESVILLHKNKKDMDNYINKYKELFSKSNEVFNLFEINKVENKDDIMSILNNLEKHQEIFYNIIQYNALTEFLKETKKIDYFSKWIYILNHKYFKSFEELKVWFEKRFIYLSGGEIFNLQGIKNFDSNILNRIMSLHKSLPIENVLLNEIQDNLYFNKKLEKKYEGQKGNKKSDETELTLLKAEMKKKQQFVSFKNVFERSKDSILSLKPCIMLSPTNVSKFLPKEKEMFDLLIIDEASQLRVVDGIGALLRSKKAIIVGDKKQLPPIIWFGGKESNNEESDFKVDDCESLLEFCESYYNNLSLKWHYRSKYPELIKFSNQEFYNNSLVTFPSVDSNYKAITYHDLSEEAFFDGDNKIEAERLINVLREEMIEQVKTNNLKSIGIIVSNSNQRETIISMIEENLEKEKYFKEHQRKVGSEKLFVKDIENVQGDERDIILISMVYGKKIDNTLRQQFPIYNRKNSANFINVMMSRAKEHIHFFCSLKHTEINADETREVYKLKKLIKFCYEYDTLHVRDYEHQNKIYDSPFEEYVDKELEKLGYETHTQVASNGFKIDLCVLSKDRKKYILAIECDGAQYHSSPFAKDRDFNRQKILESKGWSFFRIWSTDWNFKKKQVLIELEKRIKEEETNYQKYLLNNK